MTDRPCKKTLPKVATLSCLRSNFARWSGAKDRPDFHHHKAWAVSSKPSTWVQLTIGAIISLGLTACQPASEQTSTDPNVTDAQKDKVMITEDTVTLTKEHILNIKSKRYQPSLGLKGTMTAINTLALESPATAIVQDILVNQGQAVKADTDLITLQVVAVANSESNPSAPPPLEAASVQASAVSTSPTKAADEAKEALPTPPDSNSAKPSNAGASNNTGPAQASAVTKVTPPAAKTYQVGQQLTFKAPFAGVIDQLPVKVGLRVTANQILLEMSNPNDLQFIATLPIAAKSQLSVGQNVTFTVNGLDGNFTGQVSHLLPANNPEHLSVHVHIIQQDELHSQLKPGMIALGRVDYGQIEVGTIVPKSGIHNADLTALSTPPHRALTPIKAEVWIIGQDQRLSRQQISVIEFDPETQQYLVAGINNDSLICLAPIPDDSEGKKVVVS